MVKINSPFLKEIWGSIKNNTFKTYGDKRKLVLTARIPAPSYTRTTAQDQQRNKFASAVASWNALSEAEKEQYNELGASQKPPLTGYQYYIQQQLLVTGIYYKVSIDNTGNSNNLTNYETLIEISNDATFFSDAENKKESIRLYDDDKSTELSYWIEEWDTTNNNAKIWVKVPSIPASSTKTIYISIDPNRTTDNSNPTNVFMQYIDKNNTNEWTPNGYTIEENDNSTYIHGSVESGKAEYDFNNVSENLYKIIMKTKSLYEKCYMENIDTAGKIFLGLWRSKGDNTDAIYYREAGNDYLLYDGFSESSYYIYKAIIDVTNKKISHYLYDNNYNLLASAENKDLSDTSGNAYYDYMHIYDGTSGAYQMDIWINYIAIAKSADPEPSVSYTKES